MILCSYLALQYDTHEERIKLNLWSISYTLQSGTESLLASGQRVVKGFASRLLRLLGLVKS
jgi:hypothetical protein